MKGNRLVLVLVGLVIVIVVGFAFVASNDETATAPTEDESVSFFDFGQEKAKPVDIDADGATETLDNIARDSADIKSRFRGMEESRADDQRRFEQTDALIKQLTDQNKLLEAQLEAQSRAIDEMQLEPKGVDIDTIRTGIIQDLKAELETFSPTAAPGIVIQGETPPEDEGVTRVRSLNVPLDKRGQLAPSYLKSVQERDALKARTAPPDLGAAAVTGTRAGAGSAAAGNINSGAKRLGTKKTPLVVDPRYTIFADSILNNALTLTTLTGRVPKQGDLNDPAPFKVIIGNENLAANGFKIPNLKGMMMSGVAYGDKVLKCVRTKIRRATYIFEDGRGITFPTTSGGRDNVLGYLTDPYGNPCIKGQFFTDKQQRLRQSFLAGLATGAASAYASSETSATTGADGDTTLNVTGDKLKYLAGVGISTGTNKVVEQLEKEAFDIWETVVVPSGITVAVHLEQTLALDQTSLQRRIVYAGENTTQSFTD